MKSRCNQFGTKRKHADVYPCCCALYTGNIHIIKNAYVSEPKYTNATSNYTTKLRHIQLTTFDVPTAVTIVIAAFITVASCPINIAVVAPTAAIIPCNGTRPTMSTSTPLRQNR